MLLAMDTATPAVTVALHDGHTVVAESTAVDAMRAGELLSPAIQRVLAEADASMTDIDTVAVGVGPGPYTGLRVGLVTAHTMAAALGVSLLGVCSLDVLAAEGPDQQPFLVATDARRKEIYWARYADRLHRVDGPHVERPEQVASSLPVVGSGALAYPEILGDSVGPHYPSARMLAELVAQESVPVRAAEPLYLRRPHATEPNARKRVLT